VLIISSLATVLAGYATNVPKVVAAAGTTYDNLSKQLQEWTQTSFTNLYNLDKDPQTQSLFVPGAQITVNGDKLSPEKYDEHIKEVRTGATRIDVVWGDVVAIPEEKSCSISFKGSYTITRSSKIRLLGGPMQTLTHIVLEARVIEIDSEQKITSLLQTETFERPPVHFPAPVGPASSQGDAAPADASQGS
jgi:hypothetical protein